MFDVGEVRLTCKLGFKTIPEQGMTVSRPRGPVVFVTVLARLY